jgi:hypothetical protein
MALVLMVATLASLVHHPLAVAGVTTMALTLQAMEVLVVGAVAILGLEVLVI